MKKHTVGLRRKIGDDACAVKHLEWLGRFRKERKMTFSQLGDAVDTHGETLRRAVICPAECSVKTYRQLAEKFHWEPYQPGRQNSEEPKQKLIDFKGADDGAGTPGVQVRRETSAEPAQVWHGKTCAEVLGGQLVRDIHIISAASGLSCIDAVREAVSQYAGRFRRAVGSFRKY